MSAFNNDDDDPRKSEMELLSCMYMGEELQISSEDPFKFTINLELYPSTEPDKVMTIAMNFTLPVKYPRVSPSIWIVAKELSKKQIEKMTGKVNNSLTELLAEENEGLVLESINVVRSEVEDNFECYQILASAVKGDGGASTNSEKAKEEENRQQQIQLKNKRGFMREWCSFVALYKESYISGPNRFEVLMAIAYHRGIQITGLGKYLNLDKLKLL